MARTAKRVQLVREAKAAGLRPLKSHSDAKLSEMIAAGKKGGKKRKQKGSLWPADWDPEHRAAYYLQICRSEMPDDETEAYTQLVETIDELIPDAAPEPLEAGGFDCKGLYFEPKSQQCMHACPEMPLCRAICERRPELVQLAKATSESKKDIDQATDAELRAALEAQAEYEGEAKKPAKKKSKKKAQRQQQYQWGPFKALRYKEAIDDDEIFSVYKWMKRTKSFTRGQLVSQFAAITDEADELADETIAYLIEDGGLTAKE